MFNDNDDIRIEADKDELIMKLTANREKHIKEFKRMRAAYIEAMRGRLTLYRDQYLSVGDNDDLPDVHFNELPKPQSHEKDYDRALAMLKMHRGTVFEIGMRMFTRFVEDEWEWKRGFAATSRMYGDVNG